MAGESIGACQQRLIATASTIDIPLSKEALNGVLLHQFIESIADPALKRDVQKEEHKLFSDAVNHALRIEKYYDDRSYRKLIRTYEAEECSADNYSQNKYCEEPEVTEDVKPKLKKRPIQNKQQPTFAKEDFKTCTKNNIIVNKTKTKFSNDTKLNNLNVTSDPTPIVCDTCRLTGHTKRYCPTNVIRNANYTQKVINRANPTVNCSPQRGQGVKDTQTEVVTRGRVDKRHKLKYKEIIIPKTRKPSEKLNGNPKVTGPLSKGTGTESGRRNKVDEQDTRQKDKLLQLQYKGRKPVKDPDYSNQQGIDDNLLPGNDSTAAPPTDRKRGQPKIMEKNIGIVRTKVRPSSIVHRLYSKSDNIRRIRVSCPLITFDPYRPIISLVVEGRRINALLDTGASISVIMEGVVPTNYVKGPGSDVYLSSPISSQTVVGYNTILSLNIGGVNVLQDLVVAPFKMKPPVSLILGIEFFARHRAIIDFNSNKVIFNLEYSQEWDSFKKKRRTGPLRCNNIESEGMDVVAEQFKVRDLKIEEHQKMQLKQILGSHRQILIENVEEITGANVPPIEPVFKDTTCIYQRQYRIPHSLYGPLKKKMAQFEKAGIIRKATDSRCNVPVLVVPKREDPNDIRIVMDLRKVNTQIEPYRFPLMRIDDILLRLGGARYFSTLDLNNGYFNVGLAESAQFRFSFQLPWGRFSLRRLPQGLSSSAAIFQQIINDCLQTVKSKDNVLAYLDDIIIFTDTIDQHLGVLNEVLDAFKKINMAVKPSKCHLLQTSLKFLGHIIDKNGCRPTCQNTSAVTEFPRPQTVRQVRSFLGSVGFYRKYIDHFTETAAPLYLLLKKGNGKVQWSDEAEGAFKSLKSKLTAAPVLAHPDFSKTFYISTDASEIGLGGLLEQINAEGQMQPVAYCSRKLRPAEHNYAAIEKEALAIVYTLEQFRHITYGYDVILRTDHRPLTYVFTLKDRNQRLIRWLLCCQDHRVQFEHIPGRSNVFADWLSRSPDSEPQRELANINVVREPLTIKRFLQAQEDDVVCKIIRARIVKGQVRDREYILDENSLVLKRIKNFRSFGGLYRTIVPPKLVQEVITNYHDSPTSGHHSFSKTLWKIRNNFIWETIHHDVQTYVNSCDVCQKRSLPRTKAPLQPTYPSTLPLEKLFMDIIGPLSPTKRGNRYIVLYTDDLSRFCMGSALRNMEASTIAADYMTNVFARFGGSKHIVTDRGGQMTSRIFKTLCTKLGMHHILTSPYHPSANGAAERANSKIINVIAKMCQNHFSTWDDVLPYALFSINSVVHRSTNESPYYIMHGFDPIDPTSEFNRTVEEPLEDIPEVVSELTERMNLARAHVHENLARSSYNSCTNKSGRFKMIEYLVGQPVLVLDPTSYAGPNRKFKNRYKGPYRVIGKKSIVNYLVRNVGEPGDVKNVHVDRLKPYVYRTVLNDVTPSAEVMPPLNKSSDAGVKDDTVTHGSVTIDCPVHGTAQSDCTFCETTKILSSSVKGKVPRQTIAPSGKERYFLRSREKNVELRAIKI